MNPMVGPRVFVLGALSGVPTELPLAQASEQAGLQTMAAASAPAAWPLLTAALRARSAPAALVLAGASASLAVPAPVSHWLDAAHARGWITPRAGNDLDGDRLPAAWQAQLALGHVPADAALLATGLRFWR